MTHDVLPFAQSWSSCSRHMGIRHPVPLGYDVQDRKLVVNDAEAETFRLIFRRYLLLVLGWVFGAFAASSAFSRPAKSSDELGCAKTKSDLVVMPRGAEADNRWAYVGR
jgi:hypothetical protein